MTTLKAFANYGSLAHEKKVLFTVGNPSDTATHSEVVEINLPEGFEIDENAAGEQLITTPDGQVFLASEILTSYADSPAIGWYDNCGNLHREKCEIKPDTAELIKTLRAQTGLSQSDFAEQYNIPVGTIRDWEQGRRKCPEYMIELLEYKIKNEKEI